MIARYTKSLRRIGIYPPLGVNTIESTFGRSLGFVINDDNNNNNNNNNNNEDDDEDDDEDKDDHEQADVECSKRSGSCGKVVGKVWRNTYGAHKPLRTLA
ncbi:hypothetical protein HZH66_003812 [Vespula vulgaris]|uniref:Uncharacterized protein n=1 Tax=Vespula vulgaris TaxID=7454 RepID=A0A834KFN0_VESVU|nr:hypothetical protein HZH66_003812 [Vespula vulgaris]